MRETWDAGDWNQCEQVLAYLVMVRPAEGIGIAWDALQCEDETLRGIAAIAAMTYVQHGLMPNQDQIDVLVGVARSPSSVSTKAFVLWALEEVGYQQYEALLIELTRDEQAGVRFDANMRLLGMARDTKSALLADLDKLGWDVDHGVERLWWARESLNLAPDEEEMLRSRILVKLVERRQTCRQERPYNSALFLFRWLKEGFPIEPDDVDLMGQAVSHVHSNRERLDAVRAVAWFESDRAREWLRRMSEEPYQLSVRREAQRQLRRLKRV